jgi:hypothetical protein
MEGTGWTRAAFAFGAFAVAALVTTFTDHLYVGGPIMAVIFGGIAARCWYLGG